ncbi:hypothetical protein CHARACLAT_014547 [Characodon lateralis]|uniref:Uncharacterized protein n=1 Tax=Characodon lateralis TaxID=208331 RepID=A0ABU7DH52_9TELE|nr:hypothetical protein [Characodon lateralis]
MKIQTERLTSTPRPSSDSIVSPPSNQHQMCLQSIILRGFAVRDLQSWIPCSSAELRPSSAPPPPSPFHTPPGSLTFLGLHSTTSIGSQDSYNSKPKTFIQTHVILSSHVFHVFLRDPSAKDINFHQLTSLIAIFVFLILF